MSTIKDRVGDLEVRLEAFQSVNVELIRLLVEVGLDSHRKATLIKLLRDWSVAIDFETANSGKNLGGDIQKLFITYFEEKISNSGGVKQ